MAVSTGDGSNHVAAAVRSHALLQHLQGYVAAQAELRQAAGVSPYNPAALGLAPGNDRKVRWWLVGGVLAG